MKSTCPEMCSVIVPLQEAIGLYGGLISRLLALPEMCYSERRLQNDGRQTHL